MIIVLFRNQIQQVIFSLYDVPLIVMHFKVHQPPHSYLVEYLLFHLRSLMQFLQPFEHFPNCNLNLDCYQQSHGYYHFLQRASPDHEKNMIQVLEFVS